MSTVAEADSEAAKLDVSLNPNTNKGNGMNLTNMQKAHLTLLINEYGQALKSYGIGLAKSVSVSEMSLRIERVERAKLALHKHGVMVSW